MRFSMAQPSGVWPKGFTGGVERVAGYTGTPAGLSHYPRSVLGQIIEFMDSIDEVTTLPES